MLRLFSRIWGQSPPEMRVVTVEDVNRAEEFLSHHGDRWSELLSSLAKWIFATLITLSSGGIYLTLTLGLHPDAVQKALGFFFIAVVTTLISALVILVSVTRKVQFFDALSKASQEMGRQVEKAKFDEFFKFGSGYILASLFAFFFTDLHFFLQAARSLTGFEFAVWLT